MAITTKVTLKKKKITTVISTPKVKAVDTSVPISTLTCQELNDGLTPAQRQLIQGVKPLKTGATASATTGDDGDLEKGRLVNFLTLDCPHPLSGDTIRLVDSKGGQNFDGTGGTIPWYMLDLATGIAWQFNDNFTPFPVAQWIAANAAAAAHDNGTFSDFALPNRNESMTILNDGVTTTLFNYSPLDKIANFEFWTSTESKRQPLFGWLIQTGQNNFGVGVQKVASKGSIYVRNHF